MLMWGHLSETVGHRIRRLAERLHINVTVSRYVWSLFLSVSCSDSSMVLRHGSSREDGLFLDRIQDTTAYCNGILVTKTVG
jgi:hypothetical protein